MVYRVWERYITDVKTRNTFSYGPRLKKALLAAVKKDGEHTAITFCVIFPRTVFAISSMISVINAVPWITHVIFRQCNMRDNDVFLPTILDRCPRVTIVTLHDCVVNPLLATLFFQRLKVNKSLVTLEASSKFPMPSDINALVSAFTENKHLKALHLDSTYLLPGFISAMGSIFSGTSIERLRIYQSPSFLWSQFNDALFIALPYNHSIKKLFIKNGKMPCRFVDLSKNTTLKKITLERCVFYDDAFDRNFYVAHWIRTMPSLKVLSLEDCKLKNPAVEQLLLALRVNTTLVELNLRGNETTKITIPLASIIETNTTLVRLEANYLIHYVPAYLVQQESVTRALKHNRTIERFMHLDFELNNNNRIYRTLSLFFLSYFTFCPDLIEIHCNNRQKRLRYY